MLFDHKAYREALDAQRQAKENGTFDEYIIPPAKSRKMMEQVLAGTLGPLTRLTSAVDLTLDQISRWIADPENRKQINRMVTLLDAQSQLLACQYRVLAVSRLVQVISDAANHETVRRACADLMKVRLIDPYREDKRPMEAAAITAPLPTEETMLALLEQMGKEDDPDFDVEQARAQAAAGGHSNGFVEPGHDGEV